MYYAMALLVMLVLPVVSVPLERLLTGTGSHLLNAVGRWYVFWAVGVRLMSAGLRQVIQPRYTAKEILGLDADAPLQVIQELGFANVAVGAVGMISLLVPAWTIPAGITGCLFYGMAGARHFFHRGRNARQSTAMVSDVLAFAVLGIYAALHFASANG